MLERLGPKLAEVEEEVREARLKSPEGSDLLEDGFVQAARAITAERREAIANLLARGFTQVEADHAEQKKLLWLLSELSDAELLWLIHIGSDASAEFFAWHASVLGHRVAGVSSPEEDHDRVALQLSWERRLIELGLVRNALPPGHEAIGMGAGGGLETGAEHGFLQPSQLGSLLLRSIGFASQAW